MKNIVTILLIFAVSQTECLLHVGILTEVDSWGRGLGRWTRMGLQQKGKKKTANIKHNVATNITYKECLAKSFFFFFSSPSLPPPLPCPLPSFRIRLHLHPLLFLLLLPFFLLRLLLFYPLLFLLYYLSPSIFLHPPSFSSSDLYFPRLTSLPRDRRNSWHNHSP